MALSKIGTNQLDSTATPTFAELDVDNVKVNGNTISSTDTNGDITLDPNGTGRAAVTGSVTMTGTDTFNSNASGAGVLLKDSGVTSRQLHIVAPGSVSEATIGTPNSHHLLFATNNTERMRINNNGFVGIGYTSSASDWSAAMKVHIEGSKALIVKSTGGSGEEVMAVWNTGTSGTRNQILFADGAGSVRGSITTNGSSTAYNTTSDYRLKEAVVDMTGAIARVKQLAPKRFNFIVDADTTVDGFLAHEAQAVVPEAVHGEHNEVDEGGNAVMQGIDQSKLVPLLTGALQEAIAKIETLEAKVASLEAG